MYKMLHKEQADFRSGFPRALKKGNTFRTTASWFDPVTFQMELSHGQRLARSCYFRNGTHSHTTCLRYMRSGWHDSKATNLIFYCY
jgi:hypothetical protein